jgi:hypothetical protein
MDSSELKVEAGHIQNEKVTSFTMEEVARQQQEIIGQLKGNNGPSLQQWAEEHQAKQAKAQCTMNFGDSRPKK